MAAVRRGSNLLFCLFVALAGLSLFGTYWEASRAAKASNAGVAVGGHPVTSQYRINRNIGRHAVPLLVWICAFLYWAWDAFF